MITKRRLTPERMDDPSAPRAELDEALRYIRMVNQHLGGTAAALGPFKRWSRDWPKDSTIHLLDVGTGSADIPLAIAEWATRNGFQMKITAVDLHPVTLELAREFAASRGGSGIEFRQADARKLMEVFEPATFDYAHAGMFLHHLADIDVMTVLRIMDRLTSRGVIWNDLLRGVVGRVGVHILALGRRVSSMVAHDAIVSVNAGFTRREAIELAQRAGLRRITFRRHLLHRFTLVSEKHKT
jgi:ubiquinone/menaquinone biosynthesis C-methylase UbiE